MTKTSNHNKAISAGGDGLFYSSHWRRTHAARLGAACVVTGIFAFTPRCPAQLRFIDVSAERGIVPHATAPGMGTGAAAVDYDNDGDIDVFVPTAQGEPHHLYRNDGSGHFEEIASRVGLGSLAAGRVALWLDVDGDHRLDLFIAADCFSAGASCPDTSTLKLYRQLDDGTFDDITTAAGLDDDVIAFTGQHRGGICAADINNDGFIDLLFGVWGGPARLFLNDTHGSFTDISLTSGLGGITGGHWQPVMFDFNDDGWTDIFAAIDFAPNHLWINQGDNTFLDMAPAAGVDHAWNDMGVTLGDYDNDGDIDIYVTEIFQADRHCILYRNDSDANTLAFTEVATAMGVDDTSFGWGATFLDADRDGWLDLAVTNGYFNPPWLTDPSRFFLHIGQADAGFTEVAATVGLADTHWGSALVSLDYDRDGDPDLLQACNGGPLRLLENDTRSGHGLTVRPRMPGPNHRAIGAVVRVTTSNGTFVRVITAGISHFGQEPAEAVFGLGDATLASCVRVEWPDGRRTIVHDVAADQVITLEPEACGHDLDGNGIVAFPDLLMLLAAWGPSTPCTTEDLNDDGAVAFGDLLLLLAAWGNCE